MWRDTVSGSERTGLEHHSDGDVLGHGHTDQSGSEAKLDHTRFLGVFDVVAAGAGDASSGDIGPDRSFTTAPILAAFSPSSGAILSSLRKETEVRVEGCKRRGSNSQLANRESVRVGRGQSFRVKRHQTPPG